MNFYITLQLLQANTTNPEICLQKSELDTKKTNCIMKKPKLCYKKTIENQLNDKLLVLDSKFNQLLNDFLSFKKALVKNKFDYLQKKEHNLTNYYFENHTKKLLNTCFSCGFSSESKFYQTKLKFDHFYYQMISENSFMSQLESRIKEKFSSLKNNLVQEIKETVEDIDALKCYTEMNEFLNILEAECLQVKEDLETISDLNSDFENLDMISIKREMDKIYNEALSFVREQFYIENKTS